MPIKEVFVEHIGEVTISRNRQAIRFKIAIRPDGKIRVTIPWMATFHSGEKFLAEHLNWIAETREKLAKKPNALKLIRPGHLFSTRNYHYHVSPAAVDRLRIRYLRSEKQVLFEYPDNLQIESEDLQKKLTLMVENVLRFDAKSYLPLRIAELAGNSWLCLPESDH